MEGLLSLAVYIRDSNREDAYLYVDTHPQFTAFLRSYAGMRGTVPGDEVWIKESEFSSEANIAMMERSLDKFGKLI